MIYNSNGQIVSPDTQEINVVEAYDTHGDAICSVFDVGGDFILIYDTIALNQEFLGEEGEFPDENVWGSRNGPYPSSPQPWQTIIKTNAYCNGNGELIIQCANPTTPPTNPPEPAATPWTGAYIRTMDKFSYQYGTLICRMKFPESGRIYHSAVWMFAQSGNPGEIDIAEASSGRVFSGFYYRPQGASENEVHHFGDYPVDPDEYHTYRFDWTQDRVWVRCDEKLLGSCSINDDNFNSLKQAYYIILNINAYDNTRTEGLPRPQN